MMKAFGALPAARSSDGMTAADLAAAAGNPLMVCHVVVVVAVIVAVAVVADVLDAGAHQQTAAIVNMCGLSAITTSADPAMPSRNIMHYCVLGGQPCVQALLALLRSWPDLADQRVH